MSEPERSRLRLLTGSLGVLFAATAILLVVVTGPRREVERLLGARIPGRQIHITRIQPDRQLDSTRYFVVSEVDRAGFDAFVHEARLGPAGTIDWNPGGRAPAGWPDAHPEYARTTIAAHWQDGRAYLLVVDPGP